MPPVAEHGCVFCEILSGRRDAYVVLEAPDAVGFLDARPVFPGHTLVVPRTHVETLEGVPDALLGSLFSAVRTLVAALPIALDAHGTFVGQNNVVSQSVAHVHVHVVPRRFKDGLRGFFWPRHPYESDAHAADVAARIRAAVSEGGTEPAL